jgi:hypothetical protein
MSDEYQPRNNEELIEWSDMAILGTEPIEASPFGVFSEDGPVNGYRNGLLQAKVEFDRSMVGMESRDLAIAKDELATLSLQIEYLDRVCEVFQVPDTSKDAPYAVWSAVETVRQGIRKRIGDLTEQQEHTAALNRVRDVLNQEYGLTNSASRDSSAE